MSPSGPIFSPFRKGGYRGIWADKVCADRYLDWCIFPCRQHPATCNTANAEPLRVLCRNPPSPPFTKGGIIPVLADDLFDTAQQALPVFLPSPSWGEGPGERGSEVVRVGVAGWLWALQARYSPPLVKGDIGGFGQIKFVLTDLLIGAYSHAANMPQHATLLLPNLSGCSAEIPPRPPLRKEGLSLFWLMTYSIQPSKPCQFFSPLPPGERGRGRGQRDTSNTGNKARYEPSGPIFSPLS